MNPFNSSDPGKLDRRVTLLAPLTTRDAAGGVVNSWSTVATVWAEFTPQSGREIQQAGQLLALAAATFRIRYRSDIAATWRLVLDGTVYELAAPPVEVGRRVYLDLVARALDRADLTIDSDSVQAFIVDLAADDETKAITYPTAFATSPSGVWCKVLVPAGGFAIDSNPLNATRTAAGCTIQLAAAVPASGYKLSIIAVQ